MDHNGDKLHRNHLPPGQAAHTRQPAEAAPHHAGPGAPSHPPAINGVPTPRESSPLAPKAGARKAKAKRPRPGKQAAYERKLLELQCVALLAIASALCPSLAVGPADAWAILKTSKTNVRRLRARGVLTAHPAKLGRHHVFALADLLELRAHLRPKRKLARAARKRAQKPDGQEG